MQPITEIAARAHVDEKYIEQYGRWKAKIDTAALKDLPEKAKLILVTAITPTPAGEGKTTTSVGLTDGLRECPAGHICFIIQRSGQRCGLFRQTFDH